MTANDSESYLHYSNIVWGQYKNTYQHSINKKT